MTYWNRDGHLTPEAFEALANGTLAPTQRIAVAEHLQHCDECLDTYTNFLCEAPLLCPSAPLCQPAMEEAQRASRQRAQQKSQRLALAACAAAAAFGVFTAVAPPQKEAPRWQNTAPAACSGQPSSAAAQVKESVYSFFSGLQLYPRAQEKNGK